VMGWAEMLILLGFPYASDQAVELGEKLMQFIRSKSDSASAELAKERGVFPNWNQSIYANNRPMRNATRTSIAPTGTISLIAGTSSSIEPLFSLAYKRVNVLDGQTLYDANRLLPRVLQEAGLDYSLFRERILASGSVQDLRDVPDRIKDLFKTSLEIDFTFHIRHQVAFQRFTDNAVSKTINMQESATLQDVEEAYLTAWKLGAKGITVFRYGSKGQQVLTKLTDHEHEEMVSQFPEALECGVCRF
jgi:ribonucleoside-diphosphate reductase alpha chain